MAYLLDFKPLAGLFFLSALTITSSHAATIGNKPSFPTISYWDNWVDTKGISHLTKCRISAFHPFTAVDKPSQTPAPTQQNAQNQAFIWDGVKHHGKGYAIVTTIVQPPQWTNKWENTPHVQWIIPLAGTYFIETMDGTRVELNPGDVILNEDIGSIRDKNGHQGHLAGTVGKEPVALINLQFKGLNQPTHKACTQQ